ncbi:MAG: aminotransferase class IV [Deltaproteobacteria bacterium]|nr:aminotransferase class IV [Deltaproteobacteria bacterium]
MEAQPGSLVLINGEVVTPDRAVVSVHDRGFLYGDSIFEVLRTYDRKPYALAEHVERLFQSAGRVAIDMPVSRQALEAEILSAVAQTSGAGELVVRVQITRGIGPLGLDPTLAREPLRVILVEPIVLPHADDYRKGIGVVLVQTERTTDNTPAAGAKVANYLVSLLALREAYAKGAKEAIIVDGRGRVLEGTTSNVFVVKDKVILTPPESEGILPGITRIGLLEAAAAINSPVRITTLTRGDLSSADEVFISSTVREVLPVVRIDGEPVAAGEPGPVTRAVHTQFRKGAGLPMRMPWQEPSLGPLRPGGLGK